MTWNWPASRGWTIGRNGPTPSVGSVSSIVGSSTGTSGCLDGSSSVSTIVFCPARAGMNVYAAVPAPDESATSTACGAMVVTGAAGAEADADTGERLTSTDVTPTTASSPTSSTPTTVARRRAAGRPAAPTAGVTFSAGTRRRLLTVARAITPATIATLTSSASP